MPGLTVFSGSAEVSALAETADLVVDGPDGVVALLSALADAVGPAARMTVRPCAGPLGCQPARAAGAAIGGANSSTASTPWWSVPGTRMVRASCTTTPPA